MHASLRCFLLMIFLTPVSRIAYAKDKDTVYLRNVVEIAKQLNVFKKNPSAYKREDRQRLFAAIQYYNKQDNSTDYNIPDLYPSLAAINKMVAKDLISYQYFLTGKDTAIETALKTSTIIKTLADTLINLKKQHTEISTKLKNVRESLNELSVKLKDTLGEIDKLKINIEQNRQKLAEQNNASDNSQKLQLSETITSDSNHLAALNKDLQNINQNLSYKTESQIQLGTELYKTQNRIVSILQENSIPLIDFLKSLSPGNINEKIDISNISENIISEFNKSAEITIQTKIQQIELTGGNSFRIPSQSEIIDALAIYLAGRIKQEAVMWFFETLTKNIKTDALIRDFFPNTCVLLQSREVYEIPNLGTQWRYALSKDFLTMPRHIFKSEWFSKKLPSGLIDQSFITGACDIAELLSKQYNYRETIRSLYLQPHEDVPGQLVFHDFINLLYLVNNELIVPDNNSGYRLLQYEDYRNMQPQELELMLSLLDIRYNGVFSKFLKGMDSTFSVEGTGKGVTAEKIRQWLGNLQIMIAQIEKSRNEYVQLKNKQSEEGVKNMYTYNSLWQSFLPLWQMFEKNRLDTDFFHSQILHCSNAIRFISSVQDIYEQIDGKNFAGAVSQILTLIDTLSFGINQTLIELPSAKIKEVLKRVSEKESIINLTSNDSITKVGENIDTKLGKLVKKTASTYEVKANSLLASVVFEKERHSIELIKTLAGFLNDVALSKSDKQLAKVVESYAMPVGSYKRKRNNWWSVDLSAFAGPYYGKEWVVPDKSLSQTDKDVRPVYGFSVPIGLSLSKTFGKKIKATDGLEKEEILNPDKVKILSRAVFRRTHWTVTATLSLIDLGAVVSYRLKSPADTALPQEVKWSQVFSPGFHLGVAIPNTPLVFSTGVAYTPQLRKFKDASSIVNSGKQYSDSYNAVRWYAGLFFDIPLFNLWERKRIVYKNAD